MSNPAILIGAPLNFKNKIFIYPPRVKDVVTNPKFGLFYRVLTTTAEDIEEQIGDKIGEEPLPSPFEYLLLNYQYVHGFDQVIEEAFWFFCRARIKVNLDDKLLAILTDDEDWVSYLTEEEYFDFQNMIRVSCGDKPKTPPEPRNVDEDPRITRIKKLARQRDRIKEKQQGGKNGISLETCLTAICCMGIGLTPLNIGEMSYACVGSIMSMMQNKEKYDIDIKSLLAGADSKKIKPKYWIRNTND